MAGPGVVAAAVAAATPLQARLGELRRVLLLVKPEGTKQMALTSQVEDSLTNNSNNRYHQARNKGRDKVTCGQ
jgi:hypothetical protein